MESKKILLFILMTFILLSLNFISADSEEDFEIAREIIKQKIPCSELTEEQLEILGDYYMEQMHPGEVHERMDAMMGGEGSDSLKQMHINMGIRFYCDGNTTTYGMMSGGMMGRIYNRNTDDVYGTGFNLVFSLVFPILMFVVVILLIVFIIKKSR